MAFVCSYTAAKNKIKRDYTGGTCVIPNTWCRGGSAITTRNSEGYFKIFILIVFELLTFHHALIFQNLTLHSYFSAHESIAKHGARSNGLHREMGQGG